MKHSDPSVPTSEASNHVMGLLARIGRGEGRAIDELLPLVYDELRSYAGRLMAWERSDHTLQRTALVHEAYMKLVRPGATFESRLHFMNAAAQAMRRILMDHAQAKNRLKRGGATLVRLELDDAMHLLADREDSTRVDAIALDEALTRLAKAAPRQAEVVMLRFFAGCGEDDIAELLQVSPKTIRRDWQAARLWLYDRLSAAKSV